MKDNTITITLDEGAVSDTAENVNKALSTVTEASTTIVSDGKGPEITKITAKASEATKVALEFDETVKTPVAARFIVMAGNKVLGVSDAVGGIIATANQVTLTLTSGFTQGDTITVSLQAGAVKDNKDNENIATTTPMSTIVADDIAPTITGVSANDGANTKVVVAFSETLGSTINASKFKIQVNEGTATAPKSAVAGVGVDGNKVTLTVATAFAAGNTIKVTLEVGAVEDTVTPIANKNIEDSEGKEATVSDGIAPTITEASANDGANTKVIIVFSEAVQDLDKDKFKATKNGVTQKINTIAVVETNKLALTLEEVFKAGDTIGITLQAGAVKDTVGNESIVLSTATKVSDATLPYIVGISTNNGANTKVVVAFSEAVTVVDGTKFKVQVNEKTAENPQSTDVGTGEDSNKVTLNMAVPFVAGDTIKVTLDAEAVEDSENNKNENLTTASTTTVLDATLPYIVGISANDKTNTKVVVAFSEALGSTIDASKFKVQVNEGTAVAPRSAEVGTGADSNKATLTLVAPFAAGNTIKVTLEAGAVEDSQNNKNEILTTATAQSTAIAIDGTPPTITEVSANDGANTKVVVAFSEAVTVKEASKFKVQVAQGSGSASEATTTYATALAITANNAVVGTGVSANKVTLTLSKEFALGNTIKVTFDAEAVSDKTGNTNEALTTATAQSTAIVSDGIAPTITQVSANDGADTKVVVEFSEALGNTINASKFKVQVNEGTTVAIRSAVVGIGDDSNKVTLTVAPAFVVGNTIKVTLDAGATSDTTGNTNEALDVATAQSTATVSDGKGPEITKITAKASEAKKIEIEFDETAKTPVAARFIVMAGNKVLGVSNAVEGIMASANKVTLTLTSRFTQGDTITISLQAGAVKDNKDNENIVTTTPVSTIVVDDIAPKITKIRATNKETTKIVVEFNEAITIAQCSEI